MKLAAVFESASTRRRAFRGAVICAAIGLATACGFHDQSARAQSSSDAVTTSGTRLLLNGKPFEVHGVEFIATSAPPDWFRSGGPNGTGYPAYLNAYERFSNSASNSFEHARNYFGANLIEFKVSQTGFDVDDGSFTAAQHRDYIAETEGAVSLARKMGFVVDLATLNNTVSGRAGGGGVAHLPNFPSQATERVDVALAETFKNDLGVILELNNEPFPADRASDDEMWRTYIEGGPGKNGVAQVGIQDIINRMRATGARNLLLVQPYFHYGFAGYPGSLTDPANNMAFAIHPYLNQIGTSPASWDAYFGDFARTHAVVATEWSQTSGPMGTIGYSWCSDPSTLQIPRELLKYFRTHGVNGVIGWAYDIPGTLLQTNDGQATVMTGCGDPHSSVGDWMRQYFAGTLQ